MGQKQTKSKKDDEEETSKVFSATPKDGEDIASIVFPTSIPPISTFISIDEVAQWPKETAQKLTAWVQETTNIISEKDDEISNLQRKMKLLETENKQVAADLVKTNDEKRNVIAKVSQLSFQKYCLEKQLDKKSQSLLLLQENSNVKLFQLQSDLTGKNEQIRKTELAFKDARTATEIEKRERLKNAEEYQKKEMELQNQVYSLKSSRDAYTELKTKFSNSCEKYQADMRARDEEISQMKVKLRNARKIIEIFQRNNNTKQYGQLRPLENAKREPIMQIGAKSVRVDNLKKLEDCESRFQGASGETRQMADQPRDRVEELEKDNTELRLQRNDLAKQIHSLLVETKKYNQASHFAFSTSSFETGLKIDSPGQRAVTDNLVSFRNIEELQIQNQRLLTAVRDLTERHEKLNQQVENKELQLVKVTDEDIARLTETAKKYQELKEAHKLLQEKCENLQKERNEFEKQCKRKEITTENGDSEVKSLKSTVTHLSTEIKLLQSQMLHVLEASPKRSDFTASLDPTPFSTGIKTAIKRHMNDMQHLFQSEHDNAVSSTKRSKIEADEKQLEIVNNQKDLSSNNTVAAGPSGPRPFKLEYTFTGTDITMLH